MGLNMKISTGLMAQNEEIAEQQDRNLMMILQSKQINMAQKVVDFKERMIATMEMDLDEKFVVHNEMKELMAKIDRLTDQMAELVEAHGKINPIVTSVLQHASTPMGITRNWNSNNDKESYVASLLSYVGDD